MIVQSVQMYIIHKTLFYLSSIELCNSLLVLHISIDLMNFFIIEPKIRILIKKEHCRQVDKITNDLGAKKMVYFW